VALVMARSNALVSVAAETTAVAAARPGEPAEERRHREPQAVCDLAGGTDVASRGEETAAGVLRQA